MQIFIKSSTGRTYTIETAPLTYKNGMNKADELIAIEEFISSLWDNIEMRDAGFSRTRHKLICKGKNLTNSSYEEISYTIKNGQIFILPIEIEEEK